MPTVHLIIKGKVQGVFYRATAQEVAEELHVTGCVKNTPEGKVEITASGSEEQLQKFISWCKQGPPKAVVTNVSVNQIAEEEFDGFKIVR